MSTPADWGTVQQAAERLNCSAKAIRRLIASGQLEARRFGPRMIRVNLATIDDAGAPIASSGGDAA